MRHVVQAHRELVGGGGEEFQVGALEAGGAAEPVDDVDDEYDDGDGGDVENDTRQTQPAQ